MPKRVFTRDDGYVPADLVRCGVDHLSAARHLFERDPDAYDSAGYLSQLGIELILKGWLLEASGKFSDDHRLSRLYGELVRQKRAEPLDAEMVALLGKLDSFFNLRYPKPERPMEIGSEDADRVRVFASMLYHSMPKSLLDALGKLESNKKAGRILMRKPKD